MKFTRLVGLLAVLLSVATCGIVPVLQAQTSPSLPASPTVSTQAQPRANNDNVVVYVTRTGECYHRNGCSSLRRSKIKTTVRQAKSDGYRPCKRCNPPE